MRMIQFVGLLCIAAWGVQFVYAAEVIPPVAKAAKESDAADRIRCQVQKSRGVVQTATLSTWHGDGMGTDGTTTHNYNVISVQCEECLRS